MRGRCGLPPPRFVATSQPAHPGLMGVRHHLMAHEAEVAGVRPAWVAGFIMRTGDSHSPTRRSRGTRREVGSVEMPRTLLLRMEEEATEAARLEALVETTREVPEALEGREETVAMPAAAAVGVVVTQVACLFRPATTHVMEATEEAAVLVVVAVAAAAQGEPGIAV